MKVILRLADISAMMGAWTGALFLMLMVGHSVLEMTLRYGFDASTFVLDEFAGYWVAGLTFLGLAEALRRGVLIRVGVLVQMLGPSARRWVELVVVGLTLAQVALLGWYFWLATGRFWTRGITSNTMAEVPLWLPNAVILAGLAVFALQLLAYGLRLIGGGPVLDSGAE